MRACVLTGLTCIFHMCVKKSLFHMINFSFHRNCLHLLLLLLFPSLIALIKHNSLYMPYLLILFSSMLSPSIQRRRQKWITSNTASKQQLKYIQSHIFIQIDTILVYIDTKFVFKEISAGMKKFKS